MDQATLLSLWTKTNEVPIAPTIRTSGIGTEETAATTTTKEGAAGTKFVFSLPVCGSSGGLRERLSGRLWEGTAIHSGAPKIVDERARRRIWRSEDGRDHEHERES